MEIKAIKTYTFYELDEAGKDSVRHWLLDSGCDYEMQLDHLKDQLDYPIGYGVEGWELDAATTDLIIAKLITNLRLGDYSLGTRGEYAKIGYDCDEEGIINWACSKAGIRPGDANKLIWLWDLDCFNFDYDTFRFEPYRPMKSDSRVKPLMDAMNSVLPAYPPKEDIGSWLCTSFNQHVEWIHSDEYISEACEANEYRFSIYGKPVHHLTHDLINHTR